MVGEDVHELAAELHDLRPVPALGHGQRRLRELGREAGERLPGRRRVLPDHHPAQGVVRLGEGGEEAVAVGVGAPRVLDEQEFVLLLRDREVALFEGELGPVVQPRLGDGVVPPQAEPADQRGPDDGGEEAEEDDLAPTPPAALAADEQFLFLVVVVALLRRVRPGLRHGQRPSGRRPPGGRRRVARPGDLLRPGGGRLRFRNRGQGRDVVVRRLRRDLDADRRDRPARRVALRHQVDGVRLDALVGPADAQVEDAHELLHAPGRRRQRGRRRDGDGRGFDRHGRGFRRRRGERLPALGAADDLAERVGVELERRFAVRAFDGEHSEHPRGERRATRTILSYGRR